MAARRLPPPAKLLLLFDVDGTLTPPRQRIEPGMEAFLASVRPLATLGLVGGSDMCKIREQMGEGVEREFAYVFSENGLVRYEGGLLAGSHSMLAHVGEELSQRFINFCLGYLAGVRLPVKRGGFVEFRTSMLNVSPVGRSCSVEEREQFVRFDAEHGVRRRFVEAMRREFPDAGLEFALGGQISVDVFPVGWNKTFCLQFVEAAFDEIHFFGDRTDPGGNDHEIFLDARTVGHRVASPDDTRQQLERLLGLDS